MGVIVFGTRAYGRVDAHGGEYAQTTFFHVDYLPLFPTGSFWVTSEAGAQRYGHAIKLHLRSVAATYLRIWAIPAAIALLAGVGGVVGLALFGALIAASAWSWTWRSLRGDRARRRGDYNLVALGSRCEPERLLADRREQLASGLRASWTARDPGRSPNEVAQFGARDATEAAIAYGLLRLAAIERGRGGAADRAAAERLLDERHERAAAEGGPYRGAEHRDADGRPVAPPSVAAEIAAMATAKTAARAAAHRVVVKPPTTWQVRSRKLARAAGLFFMTMVGIGGVGMIAQAVAPPTELTASDLLAMSRPTHDRVAIDVDAIRDPHWPAVPDRGGDRVRVVYGVMGDRLLPIVIDADAPLPDRHVVGRLRYATGSERWIGPQQYDATLDAATFDVYVDATPSTTRMVLFGLGAVLAAATIFAWTFWIRAWRRRRRAAAAA